MDGGFWRTTNTEAIWKMMLAVGWLDFLDGVCSGVTPFIRHVWGGLQIRRRHQGRTLWHADTRRKGRDMRLHVQQVAVSASERAVGCLWNAPS